MVFAAHPLVSLVRGKKEVRIVIVSGGTQRRTLSLSLMRECENKLYSEVEIKTTVIPFPL